MEVDFFYKGTVLITFPSVSAEAMGGRGGLTGHAWAAELTRDSREVLLRMRQKHYLNAHPCLKTAKPTYQDNSFYQAVRTQLSQEAERDSLPCLPC